MCQLGQGGAQSPLGGPNSTGMNMDDTDSVTSGGSMWKKLAMGAARGAARGASGNMAQRTASQRGPSQVTGFEYRPQQLSSQEFGPGPLSGGPLGDYLQKYMNPNGQGSSY